VLIFVWIFCLLKRIGFWDLPQLCYLVLSVSISSKEFVLWMWRLWCFMHIYVELLYLLTRLFPLLLCNDFLYLFW
jgi:hypothetical protein